MSARCHWFDITPDIFTFALKTSHICTHEKRLNNSESEGKQFTRTAQLLKDKLELSLHHLNTNSELMKIFLH